MTLPAAGTTQQVAALHPAGREWKLMGTALPGNPEITAGLLPFGAVRGESSPTMAMLGKQVRQFVQESAINLLA